MHFAAHNTIQLHIFKGRELADQHQGTRLALSHPEVPLDDESLRELVSAFDECGYWIVYAVKGNVVTWVTHLQ